MQCRFFASLACLVAFAIPGGAAWAEYGEAIQQPAQKDDSRPRGMENEPPAEQLRETGFYQAGPRVGGFEGASRSVGVRAGGITLPELRLGLPIIELPSIFRSSHHARMVYKGGEAPWVSTGFEAATLDARIGRGPPEVDDRGGDEADEARSRSVDECDELRRMRDEYQQKLNELDRKLEDCNKLSRQLESLLQDRISTRVPEDWRFDRLPPDSPTRQPVDQPPYAVSPLVRVARPLHDVQPVMHWTSSEPRLLERLPVPAQAISSPIPVRLPAR